MASIVKRKSKYSVVYDYTDENGKRRQRWETFSTNAEAKKRKKQIEYEQDSGTFFIPTAKTLNDLLDEYMSIYGVNTWAMSTYESRRGLARNYITPIIGDMLLSDITPRMMDKYYRDLLSVKTVSVNNRKPTSEYLTPHTVREIHKLLRSAFNQAVRWELISRNPVLNATLPKEEHKERDIWTAETLSKAMEVCDDPILSLALNLAFSCSLRIGEMLGLTWDCIDIAPQSIENGSAYIFVNKELQRVTRGALDDLSDKGVIKKFPPCIASTHTALVLKEPKTKTSIRRVYLPKTVAYMLVERKKEIDELMDLFGDEYIDNNLVFCSSNGRPMESQVINRAFNKLICELGFDCHPTALQLVVLFLFRLTSNPLGRKLGLFFCLVCSMLPNAFCRHRLFPREVSATFGSCSQPLKSWLRLGSVQRPHNGEYQTRQAHRLAFVCVPI